MSNSFTIGEEDTDSLDFTLAASTPAFDLRGAWGIHLLILRGSGPVEATSFIACLDEIVQSAW